VGRIREEQEEETVKRDRVKAEKDDMVTHFSI